MKLLLLSDLHLDINEKITETSLLPLFIDFIKSQKVDALCLAGDISGDAEVTLDYINQIEKQTGLKVFFIPGNHDIWTTEKKKEASWKSYQKLASHPHSLVDNPFVTEEYAIIGDLGWYDYSFGSEYVYNKKEFSRKKKQYWNDAEYAKWGMEDEELLQYMLEKWKVQLEKLKDKKIIFVNHFLPFKEFVKVKYQNYAWNFCNAYMGSEKIGELVEAHPNIEYVVFGHTHTRYGEVEFKNKTIICKPLGYAGEWKTEHFLEELEDCKTILEI